MAYENEAVSDGGVGSAGGVIDWAAVGGGGKAAWTTVRMSGVATVRRMP